MNARVEPSAGSVTEAGAAVAPLGRLEILRFTLVPESNPFTAPILTV